MEPIPAPERPATPDSRVGHDTSHESEKLPPYRITNGFPIGSLDRFIQIVLGRV